MKENTPQSVEQHHHHRPHYTSGGVCKAASNSCTKTLHQVTKFFNEKFASLAVTYLLLLYFRFVHGVLYYGLSLSSGEFGGSIYLNFALTSLVEMPSHVLAIDSCNR